MKESAMTMFHRWLLVCVVAAGFSPAATQAADLLPPEREISEVVDHYIDAQLLERGIQPAPQAGDANLVRRLTLDLVGRIPTVSEVQAYAESTSPNKRAELVERLMQSEGFIRHQADEFDTLLMDGTGGSVRKYLTTAFQGNWGWDRVFRDMIIVDQQDEVKKEAVEFMRRRVGDQDQLTNEVSVVFFGINVSCAKCHDHPLVDDWTQDHFYGMKSFFNRTFDNGGFLAEREYGYVNYKTTSGESRDAKLMFLNGTVLDEPQVEEPDKDAKEKEKKALEQYKKDKVPPPAPEFSRRAQLVKIALNEDEERFFARSIVNRLIYRLYGYGLVMPVDQMHSANPPSHPQLLDWLARDLVLNNYDLTRTIRGLVMSQTYSRSSRWQDGDRPGQYYFAVANPRALTPMQFGAALKVATADPEQFAGDVSPEEREKRAENLAAGGRGYANLFEQPSENFQVSVNEALLFSNGERIFRDFLSPGGGRLVERLKQIEDPQEKVRTAVSTVLSRPADDEELKLLTAYLEKRSDRPEEAMQQIVWALLTGSEFRFNY